MHRKPTLHHGIKEKTRGDDSAGFGRKVGMRKFKAHCRILGRVQVIRFSDAAERGGMEWGLWVWVTSE
jgi:hypothetical protein